MKHTVDGKHVVITGASDGIGRALALEMAARGARVTVAARSAAKLDEVVSEIAAAGGSAVAVPTDVTVPASCAALVDAAVARHGDVDILVCNAGIGSASQGDDVIPVDAIRRIMEVNFMGAVQATAAALPSLRRTHGLVVAVSSLQGLFAFPNAAGYAASKHAMQGFFDSLRLDLTGAVDVLVVSPRAGRDEDPRRRRGGHAAPVDGDGRASVDACASLRDGDRRRDRGRSARSRDDVRRTPRGAPVPVRAGLRRRAGRARVASLLLVSPAESAVGLSGCVATAVNVGATRL